MLEKGYRGVKRRDFLKEVAGVGIGIAGLTLGGCAALPIPDFSKSRGMKGKVMTVLGPLSPDDLGATFTHEHLVVDLSCWLYIPNTVEEKEHISEPVNPDNLWWVRKYPYSSMDNLLLTDKREAIKEAEEFKRLGGGSFVDATSLGLGRDPEALRDISLAAGVNVIMGSGYYCAASLSFEMYVMTEEEIAEAIIKDVNDGVGETGIRAGMIGEIGISNIRNDREESSLRGAIIAQKETGAPLSIHPPYPPGQCEEVLEILEEERADLEKVIICHSEMLQVRFRDLVTMLADAGVYTEYDIWGLEGRMRDGLYVPSDRQRLQGIERLLEEGHLDNILLSQDICMKVQTTAYGGYGRSHIFKNVLPLFTEAGITEEEIQTMLVENPKRALRFI